MSADEIPPIARTWWSGSGLSPTRMAKHELVDRMREVIAEVALLDVEEVDAQELDSLIEQCSSLRDRLRAQPSLRDKGGPQGGVAADLPLTERGPISGMSNPLAAPLRPSIDSISSDRISAHVVFSSAYEGPKGVVHGGMVLAIFDEVLALAQLPSGTIGMTGTVSVRLLRPTPIDKRIDFEGGVERVDGKKIHTWARSMANGDVLVEATAICILAKSGEARGG